MQTTHKTLDEIYTFRRADGHITVLGYDKVLQDTAYMVNLMGMPANAYRAERGSQQALNHYMDLCQKFAVHKASDATWYAPGTPDKVRQLLDQAMASHARGNAKLLRLFYGDPATGQDSCESFDILGAIGRSMGAFKVPLLIPVLSSTRGRVSLDIGGGEINSQSVLRVMEVSTCKDLYRASNYRVPGFRIESKSDIHAVIRLPEGERDVEVTHAVFRTKAKAQRFIGFMQGITCAMPDI